MEHVHSAALRGLTDLGMERDQLLAQAVGRVVLLAQREAGNQRLGCAAPLRNLALLHMTINLAGVAIFAVNLWVRTGELQSMLLPLGLSVLGIVLLGVSGWIGGELVHVHMVGVDPDAASRKAVNDHGTAAARAARDAHSHT